VPPLSHLTSCTSTKSNLYLANSLATVVSDPDVQRLITFQVPNLTSLFHSFGCNKGSVQAQGNFKRFITRPGEELLAPCPTPKLEDHPLSVFHNCVSIYSQLPSILEAIHPQPQNAQFYCNKGTLIIGYRNTMV